MSAVIECGKERNAWRCRMPACQDNDRFPDGVRVKSAGIGNDVIPRKTCCVSVHFRSFASNVADRTKDIPSSRLTSW